MKNKKIKILIAFIAMTSVAFAATTQEEIFGFKHEKTVQDNGRTLTETRSKGIADFGGSTLSVGVRSERDFKNPGSDRASVTDQTDSSTSGELSIDF